MTSISIIKPDDWHTHLRDTDHLSRTVADTVARFQRAVIMPNLKTPVTTVSAAQDYKTRIESHLSNNANFTPLMTLFITQNMPVDEIKKAKESGIVIGCKLYPHGATTNSDAGVNDLSHIYPIFEAMQEQNLVLQIHGESIAANVDIFDREAQFIEQQLKPLIKAFPTLRIVLEHISTKKAVEFITSCPDNVAATITAHHLLYNRNAIFDKGIRPHYYCLPILKRNEDQEALIKAATSGGSKFFLGTDSAPHTKASKETSCGCAGIYTAHAALELYAEVFDKADKLDKLEQFASINGATFYDMPINTDKITLTRKSWQVPATLSFGGDEVIPLRANQNILWTINNE